MQTLNNTLRLVFVATLLAAPAVAMAASNTHPPTAHVRTMTAHDHTPQAHVYTISVHRSR